MGASGSFIMLEKAILFLIIFHTHETLADEISNEDMDSNAGRMINIPTELIQDYFVENNGRDRYLCIIDTVPNKIQNLLENCKQRYFPDVLNAEMTETIGKNDQKTLKLIERWGRCLVRNFPTDRIREALKYPMDCML